MNLRFVEAYYWVVMLRSVTRAAEKLHLTQSAVSSRIAVLEQDLGTLLLDRRDKAFRVTVAGQRFFGYCEKLLALQREIRAELGGAGSQPVTLRVGAIESVLHSWLMDWVRALRALALDPAELTRRRLLALDYVRSQRMHSDQAEMREGVFRSLLADRNVLEADRQTRLGG
jgi:hypothetical protein